MEMAEQKKGPVHTTRIGLIKAAVWKNEGSSFSHFFC
jgi:hypothetical protein